MGIIEYEQLKLRQQKIEVKALIALTKQDKLLDIKIRAIGRLAEIAFPDIVTEKINRTLGEYE